MRAFKFFTVRLNFITGNELQWSLNSGFNDPLPYHFIVETSSTIDFSEIIYTIDAGDNFFAIDNSNIKQNWTKDLYYRVKLTTGDPNSNSVSIYYSEPLSFDSAPTTKRKYRMAVKIMNKHNILFKFTGLQGYLLKRKIYGQIDKLNVDPITGIPMNDKVGGFGTGIVGGYYNPVSMSFQIVNKDQDKSLSPDGQGSKESYDLVVRANGFPAIDTHDIIVKAETNQRYNVIKIKLIIFPGTEIVTMQKLNLKLIPMGDNIYKIPVPSYQVPQLPLDQQPGN